MRDATGDNSVLRMVALSEGLMPFASKEAYIYRRDENGLEAGSYSGSAQEKIMLRKSPDVTLEADERVLHSRQQIAAHDVYGDRPHYGVRLRHCVGLAYLALNMKNTSTAISEYRAIAGPNTAILDTEYEPQAAHVPLYHYIWILRRHGWKIAGFVAAVVIATLIVSLRLTPIYESTVTVDIDRQMPTGVLGQEAMQNATNDADQFLATQVKLIQSDSVMRPVVDKYKLRDVEKDALEEAIDKSPTSNEAPVVLKHLKVTRPPNTYLLLISYRSANRQLAADVANQQNEICGLSYLAHLSVFATRQRRV